MRKQEDDVVIVEKVVLVFPLEHLLRYIVLLSEFIPIIVVPASNSSLAEKMNVLRARAMLFESPSYPLYRWNSSFHDLCCSV